MEHITGYYNKTTNIYQILFSYLEYAFEQEVTIVAKLTGFQYIFSNIIFRIIKSSC